jgi:hypothetical protein
VAEESRANMRVVMLFLSYLFSFAAFSQRCPPENGHDIDAQTPASLHGTIYFHNVTRGWVSVVPDHPVCSEKEIELVFRRSEDWSRAKSLQGCTVTVKGKISDSITAYYSTQLNFFDPAVVPDVSCKPRAIDPDPTKTPLPRDLQSYRAIVYIDVKHNLPLRGTVWNAKNEQILSPSWKSYAQPSLNGEKDLDLACHDGFTLQSFSSDPPKAAQLFTQGVVRLTNSELGRGNLTIICKREKTK